MIVLDIGPGIRAQNMFEYDTLILVEPHYEYVEFLQKKFLDAVILQITWQQVVSIFPSNSVDIITLHDIIEHIEKEEAEELLQNTIPIARKGVSVFTPLGFMEQTTGEDGADEWGYHGGLWQNHRSGWFPEEFPGWNIQINPPGIAHECFWAYLDKG